MFIPVVKEIRQTPAEAGQDTFIADLTTPRTPTPVTTIRGATA